MSADFCYLYPVGLWDVPSDVHFELDLFAAVSSNPTLAPLLGKVKFRVEAYFVEKAAYVNRLRDNDKLPVDRNVPFPMFHASLSNRAFSPRTGILEYLQMYPAGWYSGDFGDGTLGSEVPSLNAIPFIMYYDIYRNYYINPQDDNIPIRDTGFVPGVRDDVGGWTREPEVIQDVYVTRQDFDDFIRGCRDSDEVDVTVTEYGFPQPFGVFIPGSEVGVYRPNEIHHKRYMHHGLLRRTLGNDFFTSFVSNDNVELMKSRANVQINNNVLNVEQISLANRNWRIATRSLLWGTDWKDYNKVHYGVNLMIPYGKPQFLGALSSDITFNDVISQAQTTADQNNPISSNQNLGSRAGIAYGGLQNHKGHFVEFNTKDEGYVMVLASLVPEVDYYQGIDPMYFKTNLQHSWMVELNSVGMQDFHRAWMTVLPFDETYLGSVTQVPFSSWNVAEHKVPIWFEYMAKYNQLHGLFTGANQLRYWVFARPFTNLNSLFPNVFNSFDEQADTTPFTSTYGMPEMFNYIFANNIGTDNFQLQFNFDCKVSSMLDKQVIAYL